MNLKLASLPWSAVQWKLIERSLRSIPQVLNLWKRPLLLAAIGLHALILVLPTPNSSTQEKPAPKEVIKVSQLAAAPPKPAKPKAAKPKAAKPKTAKPKAAKPKTAKPKATRPQRSTPAAAPRPKPKAEQPDRPEQPDKPEPAPTPDAAPPPVNSTGGDGTGSGKGLVDELSKEVLAKLLESGTNDQATLQEFMASIPETIPESVYGNFVGEDGQILVDRGAFASLAIPQMSASAAFLDYIEPILSQKLGFTVNAVEPAYGGSPLYEAKNAGGVSFFFSLVKLTNSSGAFMVLWKTDPRTT
ncbi:MAG: hypothetical protein EA001_03915 [Oscillatoriales cyanobacterium]|nr:MAG: hypothetical protein EA001_03915 [Oscillatoriales cyanobacterium]